MLPDGGRDADDGVSKASGNGGGPLGKVGISDCCWQKSVNVPEANEESDAPGLDPKEGEMFRTCLCIPRRLLMCGTIVEYERFRWGSRLY